MWQVTAGARKGAGDMDHESCRRRWFDRPGVGSKQLEGNIILPSTRKCVIMLPSSESLYGCVAGDSRPESFGGLPANPEATDSSSGPARMALGGSFSVVETGP